MKKLIITGDKVVNASIVLGLIADFISVFFYSDYEALYLLMFMLFAVIIKEK